MNMAPQERCFEMGDDYRENDESEWELMDR